MNVSLSVAPLAHKHNLDRLSFLLRRLNAQLCSASADASLDRVWIMVRRWAVLLWFLAIPFVWCAASARAVTIDWVRVGNAGNAPDPNSIYSFGSVAYSYSIDKYDVTVGQYTDFLNAVAADRHLRPVQHVMATDLNIAGIARSGSSGSYTYSVIGSSANLPITYVSWGDAARFANWLQNGQPTWSGGVRRHAFHRNGAYTLNGQSPIALDAVTRNADATIVIPSEDEWYKAAYYDPANAARYYQYPFSSNTMPTSRHAGQHAEHGELL